MALLLPVFAAGAGAVYAANNYEARKSKLEAKIRENERQRPVSGYYSTYNKVFNSQGKVVQRVYRDVDLRGVPVYMVDYGNGAMVRQYAPPDELFVGSEGVKQYTPMPLPHRP